MGSLDTRGVYIYDENDQIAPLHTLLNLGQASVSEALGETLNQWAIDHDAPFRLWVGAGNSHNTATAPYGVITVNFPPGRFTRTPIVFAQAQAVRGGQLMTYPRVVDTTTQRTRINVITWKIASGGPDYPIDVQVYVLAIQMLENSATG